MTINIALATSDALVLGCDSVASTSEHFVDPFQLEWDKDENDQPIQDGEGKFKLRFAYSDMQQIITNARGSVTKMFEIHPRPSPIVAVTSGLAKLNNRSTATHAADFRASRSRNAPTLAASAEIADEFLKFIRARYDENYKGSPIPENFREGPEFLVGGYGRDEDFPSNTG